jgi:hypothetical protein
LYKKTLTESYLRFSDIFSREDIQPLVGTMIKPKFNRAEIFDEVDKSNLRFNSYTKAQRKAFGHD